MSVNQDKTRVSLILWRFNALLIAAAALAAGVISSEAQAVYSQNIVGYVNQVFPAGQYSQVVIPVQPSTNSANAEIVFPNVQPNDNVLVWNGGGFDTYIFAAPGVWIGPNGPGAAPTLNAGQAIFYQNNSSTYTNTYTGTVVLTNNATLINGYNMIGSVLPISGAIDSTNFALPLNANDNILMWNGSSYDTYIVAAPGVYIGPNGPQGAPTVNVGQSFFYQNNSGAPVNWIQSLTP